MAHDGDHGRPHAPGHNRGPEHLASALHGPDAAADLQVLTAQFIDGFREARDKNAYLRIAGVPFELADAGGGPPLKLVDVELRCEWQVASAAPAFGSRELNHLPFPGEMIAERANMAFVYVSLDARRALDLRDLLAPCLG